MAKGGFLARHGIVRNAIREDMLYFALPGLLVFTAGLVVSRVGCDESHQFSNNLYCSSFPQVGD